MRVGASRRVGTILCLGGAAIGALGLLADLAGVRVLAKITPGLTLSAAVSLMLTGCAGALRARADAFRKIARDILSRSRRWRRQLHLAILK